MKPYSMAEIVYGQRPPNFDVILAAFPLAARPGVVFAYGHQIFVPSGNQLPHELILHENVHCKRQLEFGLDAWWRLYIEDDAFRYNEELLAHRAEYQYLCDHRAKSRIERRHFLNQVAKKLSAPLYGRVATFERAKRDLTHDDYIA